MKVLIEYIYSCSHLIVFSRSMQTKLIISKSKKKKQRTHYHLD